jgi:hypothetical protein
MNSSRENISRKIKIEKDILNDQLFHKFIKISFEDNKYLN